MTTTVVYGDAADGSVRSGGDDYVYASARSGAALYAATGGTVETFGQMDWSYQGDYWVDQFLVYEFFLSFDTSALTSGATVSAAVLRVTSADDRTTTDFTIEARLRDWGATLTTADWVAGASLSGLTLLGSYATSGGFTTGTGYDLSDTAMAANINKTGSTRMLLCSSRTVSGTDPTGEEYVNIRAADYTGTTSDPVLTVTHAAGGSTLFLMLEDDSGAYELEDDSGGILLEPGA